MKHIPSKEIIARGESALLGVYKRFPVVFSSGRGSRLFDVDSKEYLDFASGIAVTSLGHANPEINEVLRDQAGLLSHVSNLYYTMPQVELAEKLQNLIGNGKIFFSNSGAEANECLIKLARAYGNCEAKEKSVSPRHEIICMHGSFHGRTLATISATGQEKVKAGFDPLPEGFLHANFNDLEDLRSKVSGKTVAIMIEGIQGEGGVISATPEFLLGVRKLCDENKILLLFDSVQCGFFRTGSFQSYTEILKDIPDNLFIPDAISMAKSLGGGFPIGATWIKEEYTSYLPAGSHGTTYGGNALGCRVASKIIDVVKRDSLAENARSNGERLKNGLIEIQKQNPLKMKDVRGMGLLLGIELQPLKPPPSHETLPPASYFCLLALHTGLLLVPAGSQVVRMVPQLGVSREEIDEGLERFSQTLSRLPDALFDMNNNS